MAYFAKHVAESLGLTQLYPVGYYRVNPVNSTQLECFIPYLNTVLIQLINYIEDCGLSIDDICKGLNRETEYLMKLSTHETYLYRTVADKIEHGMTVSGIERTIPVGMEGVLIQGGPLNGNYFVFGKLVPQEAAQVVNITTQDVVIFEGPFLWEVRVSYPSESPSNRIGSALRKCSPHVEPEILCTVSLVTEQSLTVVYNNVEDIGTYHVTNTQMGHYARNKYIVMRGTKKECLVAREQVLKAFNMGKTFGTVIPNKHTA